MIDIITTVPDCGQPLGCFKIDIETDSYKLTDCADSTIQIKLIALPTDGSSFDLELKDADGNTLFDETITFKNTPVDIRDCQIGASILITGNNLSTTISNIASIIGLCSSVSLYNSGSVQYYITLTYTCAIGEFVFSQSGTDFDSPTIVTAATTATFEENFKVTAKVIDCPYNGNPFYSTIIDGMDVFFDKNQYASVYLTNRLKSFLSTDKPDLNSILQANVNYQRKVKVLFTEFTDGVAGDAAATTEFIIQNNSRSTACSGFYNQIEMSLCKDQYAFAYFFVKYPGSGTTITIKNGTLDVIYTSSLTNAGLHSLQVTYQYLLDEEIIEPGDSVIHLILHEDDGSPLGVNYELDVNFICECHGDITFLFLTDEGIYESLMMRIKDSKLKAKKELLQRCKTCADLNRVFAVDIQNNYIVASPRIAFEDADKWAQLIISKSIYAATDGLIIEVTNEGGEVTFKKEGATEFNIDYNLPIEFS